MESAKPLERAKSGDRTMGGERATEGESSKRMERAIRQERTKNEERAKLRERTTEYERIMNKEPTKKLTRKTIRSAITERDTAKESLRYMVDQYYQLQEYRKASGNQVSAINRGSEAPQPIIESIHAQIEGIEKQLQVYLDEISERSTVGRWAKSIVGIGGVISAGLLAHIDIAKAPTVGHIWRFAGLDPTMTWEPKTKRPWNASLKTLCWKIGESFVKVSNNPEDFYGKVYMERKEYEMRRNMAGELKDQAAAKLQRHKIGKDTEAYKHYSEGFLPPAHIHARAKRYAVKLFLAHYHHVAWESEYGTPPPKPYIIAIGGHADYMPPPNWPMEAKHDERAIPDERAKRPERTTPRERAILVEGTKTQERAIPL